MRKALSIILCIAMLMSTLSAFTFAAPSMVSGVETAGEDVAQATQNVTGTLEEDAVYTASNGEPGLNLLTGTLDAIDFENSALTDFWNSGAELATMATDSNADNKAIKLSSQYAHFNITPFALNNTVSAEKLASEGPSIPVVITDTERPLSLSFDYIANAEIRYVNTPHAASNNASQGRTYVVNRTYDYTTTWKTGYSFDISSSQLYHSESAAHQRLYIMKPVSTGGDYYIDNISLVPYYRVTYNYNDGTASASIRYALPAATNGVRYLVPDSTVVPEREGYKFVGWSTRKDATVGETSIALGNSDIELFAVWSDFEYKSSNGEPGLNLLTGTREDLDLEHSLTSDFWVSGAEITTVATAENEYNKAFALAGQWNHFNITPNVLNNTVSIVDGVPKDGSSIPVSIDRNRPITLTFDYIANGEIRYTNTAAAANNTSERTYVICNTWDNTTEWTKDYSVEMTAAQLYYNDTAAHQRLYIMKTTAASKGTYYFDNISLVPHYYITYDYNDLSGATEGRYVLPKAVDGVRTLVPDETIVPQPDEGFIFLGWSTDMFATEPDESIVLGNSDITLYAVYGEEPYKSSNGEPGLNLLTGTTVALDFEKSVDGDFWTANASLTTKETADNASNKAMMIEKSGNFGHFSVTPNALNGVATVDPTSAGAALPVVTDADRTYTLTFDYIAKGEIRFVNTAYGANDNGDRNFLISNPTINSTEWTKYTVDFKGADFSYDAENTKTQRLFIGRYANYGEGTYYFDNLSLVPNYKVTYNYDDGTTKVEYVLPELNAEGVREFVPSVTLNNTRNAKFIGWATEKNETEAVSKIVLADKDIELYPVWEEKYAIPGVNVLTGTKQAIDFENAETADFWTVSSEVVTMATDDNETNKAMKMAYASNVTNFFNLTPFANNWRTPEAKNVNGSDGPSLPATIEDERPVTVSFNYIADDEFRFSNTAYGANVSGENVFIFHFGTVPTNGEWATYNFDFTGADLYAKDADMNQAMLFVRLNTKGSSDYYFDNISVVPHFKVTYVYNNGTDESEDKYTLPYADKATGARIYTPDATVKPEYEGYYLAGWTTDEKAETVMNTITLDDEDITLYAVWKENSDLTPTSYNVSSIRTGGYSGIRFMASVTSEQKAAVAEYGFIVTLASHLGDKELTHDCGVNYVTGVNYGVVDGESVDKIYKITDDSTFFTAVVYGIPQDAASYKSSFVVRPYTKTEDGTYYYGNAVVKNVYEIACTLRDRGYAGLDEEGIEFVKSILEICGESTEA